jgi:hypothetical protein
MVMDVSSVSSGAGAYSTAIQQTSQSQQAQQVAEKREPRPENRVEPVQEGPKPIKNADGQTTGSVISVTA